MGRYKVRTGPDHRTENTDVERILCHALESSDRTVESTDKTCYGCGTATRADTCIHESA